MNYFTIDKLYKSSQFIIFVNIQPGNKIKSLDATHLSTGVYLVKFSGRDIKSVTKKWIKL